MFIRIGKRCNEHLAVALHAVTRHGVDNGITKSPASRISAL